MLLSYQRLEEEEGNRRWGGRGLVFVGGLIFATFLVSRASRREGVERITQVGEELFESSDCEKYMSTSVYTAQSCALWDQYQCDMGCGVGSQCESICGDMCSEGAGAICALVKMNSSTSLLSACAQAKDFAGAPEFQFPSWADERTPADWNGNVTHGPYYIAETSPFQNSSGCDHHLICTYRTDFFRTVMAQARVAVSSGAVPDFMGNHLALFNSPWFDVLCDWAESSFAEDLV